MAWFRKKSKEFEKTRELINGALTKADSGIYGANDLLAVNKRTFPDGQVGVPNAITVTARDNILLAKKELANSLREIADKIDNGEI